MEKPWLQPALGALLVSLGLVGCGGGEDQGAATEEAAVADTAVLGYYEYADAVRGSYSLAVLEDNRFMLVVERPDTALAPLGVAGWWVLRDDQIMLSAPGLDIEGTVGDGGILELSFVDPLEELAAGPAAPEAGVAAAAGPDGKQYSLPFKRVTGGPETGGQEGGEKDGGQDGEGGDGGS